GNIVRIGSGRCSCTLAPKLKCGPSAPRIRTLRWDRFFSPSKAAAKATIIAWSIRLALGAAKSTRATRPLCSKETLRLFIVILNSYELYYPALPWLAEWRKEHATTDTCTCNLEKRICLAASGSSVRALAYNTYRRLALLLNKGNSPLWQSRASIRRRAKL